MAGKKNAQKFIEYRVKRIAEEVKAIRETLGLSEGDLLLAVNRAKVFSSERISRQIKKKGMETHEQAFEPIPLVRVEASRHNAGGEALLYYQGEYSRFEEVLGSSR